MNIHSLDPTVRLRTCIYSWLRCIISIIHIFHFSFSDRKRTVGVMSTKLSLPAAPQVLLTCLDVCFQTLMANWRHSTMGHTHAGTHTTWREQPVLSHSLVFCVWAFFPSENGVNSPINIVFSRCLATHCFQIIRQDYSTGFTINPLIPSLPGFPLHSSSLFITLTFLHFFTTYFLTNVNSSFTTQAFNYSICSFMHPQPLNREHISL